MNFVQQFDAEPQFWQFLKGLDLDDLIIELVQNELDASASHTSITFYPDRLVCEGDGEPVSEDGWRRLAFVMGAGDQVESKRFRIGVKNHGLKACFRLGDEVIVRSDGRRTIQTLYKDGPNNPPSPGTLPEPVYDEGSPLTGCSVEVPYRRKRLVVAKGEPLEIDSIDDAFVERVFRDAYTQLPGRLMGVVRPGIRDQYTLSLNHHNLGSVDIHWRAKRPWHVNGRGRRQFTLFSRECAVSSNCSDLQSEVIHERACTFKVRFPSRTRREISEFFALDNRYFVTEIAWLTDMKGRPRTSKGVRRYPIGYAPTSKSALTCVGVHFSGPYVSDAERHGASQLSELNGYIDEACRNALVEVMRSHLLHQYRGKVMELYMDDPANPDIKSLLDMIKRSIDKHAIPLQSKVLQRPKSSATRSSKISRRSLSRIPLGPRKTSKGYCRRIVLPKFTWDDGQLSSLLAEICPEEEDQIDRRVPATIISLIHDNLIEDIFMTFDENDAVERLQPRLEANYFPWKEDSEWQSVLSNVLIAKKHLDAVYEATEKRVLSSEAEVAQNAYLPDENSVVRSLDSMHSAVNLPPSLPERQAVSILHRDLQSHPLLKRKLWKLNPFTLDDYLDLASLKDAVFEDRLAFWEWLRSNAKRVNDRQLRKIKNLPIWPSDNGTLLTFEELCKPPIHRMELILRDTIRRPSPEILKAGFVNKSGTGRLKFRRQPTQEEVDEFLWIRMLSVFPDERPLTAAERNEFHKFESNLAVLASSPRLRKILADLSDEYAVALSQDGTLKPPDELVRVEGVLQELHLPSPTHHGSPSP